jgi:hypothetical protein
MCRGELGLEIRALVKEALYRRKSKLVLTPSLDAALLVSLQQAPTSLSRSAGTPRNFTTKREYGSPRYAALILLLRDPAVAPTPDRLRSLPSPNSLKNTPLHCFHRIADISADLRFSSI